MCKTWYDMHITFISQFQVCHHWCEGETVSTWWGCGSLFHHILSEHQTLGNPSRQLNLKYALLSGLYVLVKLRGSEEILHGQSSQSLALSKRSVTAFREVKTIGGRKEEGRERRRRWRRRILLSENLCPGMTVRHERTLTMSEFPRRAPCAASGGESTRGHYLSPQEYVRSASVCLQEDARAAVTSRQLMSSFFSCTP